MTVSAPELQRLGDVFKPHIVSFRQVGDGARDAADAVEPAGAQAKALGCLSQ